MIEYGTLYKALRNLVLQHENYLSLDNRSTLLPIDREAVAESVIQRFEIAFDCLWKTLKRYLKEDLGLADLRASPKPLFRLANENRLINDKINQWLRYADLRNTTTHEYSEKKINIVLSEMQGFITDALGLYETMSTNKWTL